jgi:hypothetical protein
MDFIQCDGVEISAKLPRASDRSDDRQTSDRLLVVGRFSTYDRLQAKQIALLGKLSVLFTDELLRKTIVSMTRCDSLISLRAVDWCVTNYAKKHDICIVRVGETFNIFFAYKTALAHYRRRNFDPFRRRLRVTFELDDETHVTTPGQLQFFMWAHNLGVLQYIEDNVESIVADMNLVSRTRKRERQAMQKSGVRMKRTELSKAAAHQCRVSNVPVDVTFR